jgi:hypothetical protein
MDNLKPETWAKIKPQDILILKDERTITEAVTAKEANALQGKSMTVVEVRRISEQNNLAQFLLAKLDLNGQVRFLFVKVVDQNFDVRLYNQVGWFEPAARAEVIKRNDCFLFAAPADPSNFITSHLEMAESFPLGIDGKDVSFDKKNATLYGEATLLPAQSGINKEFTQITEYLATEPIADNELLVLEFGGLDIRGRKMPQGGLIVFFEGYTVKPEEILILPVN